MSCAPSLRASQQQVRCARPRAKARLPLRVASSQVYKARGPSPLAAALRRQSGGESQKQQCSAGALQTRAGLTASNQYIKQAGTTCRYTGIEAIGMNKINGSDSKGVNPYLR